MYRPFQTFAILAFAMAPLSANAVNYSNSPGIACVSSQAPGSSTLQPDTTYYGAVRNSSSSSAITVLCPIQRDEFVGGFDGGSETEVWVIDDSSGGDISCRICARDLTAPTSATCSSSYTTTSRDSSTVYELNLDDSSLATRAGDLSVNSNYVYYLSCSLPKTGSGSAYIIGYEIDEED